MTYEEVQEGQRVRLPGKGKDNGTVHAKEIIHVNGRPIARVYVDPDRGGRRLCAPSVLTLLQTGDQS